MFERFGDECECGWEPIKGAIHIDETEEQTILREIKEEAGPKIKVKVLGKLPECYLGENLGKMEN